MGKALDAMKLDIPLFAGLLVIGTTLLVRTQVQGLEAALLATAVEYGFRGMRAGTKVLRSALCWMD